LGIVHKVEVGIGVEKILRDGTVCACCNRALVLSSFCIYFVIVAYAKISANLIDAITIKKPLSWLLSQELADYN